MLLVPSLVFSLNVSAFMYTVKFQLGKNSPYHYQRTEINTQSQLLIVVVESKKLFPKNSFQQFDGSGKKNQNKP